MLTVMLSCLLIQTEEPKAKLELPTGLAPPYALAEVGGDGKSIAIERRFKIVLAEAFFAREITKGRGTVRTTDYMKKVGRRVSLKTKTTTVQVPYTVEVPYTEQIVDENGNKQSVTRTRTEQRMRTERRSQSVASERDIIRLAECKFTDLAGEPIDATEAARRLARRSPILLDYPSMKFDPFYKATLNPSIMIVRPPLPSDAPKTPEQGKKTGLQLPTNSGPLFALAKADADGESIALIDPGPPRTITEQVPNTYTVTVLKKVKDKDGVEKMVPTKEKRNGKRTVARTISGPPGKPKLLRIAECRFTDLSGKPIEPATVARRLEKQSPVLIAKDGMKLEKYFVSALHPDTMLVKLPNAAR